MSNNLVQTISLKDNGYSQGVKSAKQALQELGRQNGVVNNSFRNTSKELNSAKKFYGQLKEEYDRLSEDAKRSEFGKAIHAQIETTKADLQSLYEQTAKTRKELADMQDQANKKISGGKGGFSMKEMGGDMLDKFGMGSLTKISAGPMALTAMLAGVGEEYVRSTKLAMEYESALSNLKAITGVAGKDFDTFKEKIEATGFATSKSFEEVTDAYTKVGSAMPELLKAPNALDAVTRAAITLSKASRMDLDSAINSLTGIMNQFGASASQANSYINALAAGAKEGSAGIEYLATAMDKCGTSLASTNMSVEQGTALIEVLAKKIPDASTAGTNLRNILLKMSQAQDKFNPKVVGMEQALKNLQPKIKDTAFMVKMFGSENVNAAITLAQNVDKYTELTQKVSGTNEAFIQAKTQTDNLASAMTKLSTNWDNFIVSINKSTGPLSWATNKLADFVKWLEKHWNLSHKGGYATLGFGDDSGWKDKETPKEQRDAFYEKRGKLDKRIKEIKDAQALVKQRLNEDYSESIKNAFRASLRGYDKSLKQLYEERNRMSREYANTVWNSTQTSITTETTTTTDTSKTKSPKEIYDEKISQIEAQLANKFIDEKKAIEEKIAAIKQYISALSTNEKSIKKNKNLIDTLSQRFKGLKERLILIEAEEADAKAVQDADKNYVTTIAKLNRARENKWISETEYQTQYISAIKDLIKGYQKVTNMSEDMVKVIGEKQKEIKAFELKQAQDKAITHYLSSYRDVERIVNRDENENILVSRQAPANSVYKAHETAYLQLLVKAKNKPKDENWLKDYQQYLKDNKYLLGRMHTEVKDLDSAIQHAKKIEVVFDIQEGLNRGEKLPDLMSRYKKDLKLSGFEFEFDKDKFEQKLEELGLHTEIPVNVEPTPESVTALAERFAPNTTENDALKKFSDKYWNDVENLIELLENQFPDTETLFKEGDASNFSIKENPSYYRLNKQYTKFNQGNGRLNDNLMDDRITQKMNDELDQYLAKYRDVEEIYVRMKQEAEENGLDFSFENSKIDKDLTDLESKIATLHDQIQDRLTFELRIEGAQDALDGLGSFANIGSSLASLPDTFDNISDSSNDAAAAFQYFGAIIGTIQDIIDAVKISMEVYKGIQDLFTASTVAQDLALKDKTASQATEMAVSEAAVATKTTEAVANKALEASLLDLAAAEIFAAHAYIPFAGVPIATSNVGAMMGTMAGVHATSASFQAFANGGIVGGDSFSGDKTLIRANKGEMILNNQQQGNLFALLDGVVGTNQGGGKVKFEISGDNLVGVLNNHNRMKSKVGNRLR